jgi:transposase InsO family protein
VEAIAIVLMEIRRKISDVRVRRNYADLKAKNEVTNCRRAARLAVFGEEFLGNGEAWRVDYNARRPHSSLGHLTPNEFVAQRQAERTAIAAGFSS